MNNTISKKINSSLKFVYSDNNSLSVIFHDNDLLMVYANNDPSVCQLLPPLTMSRNEMDWVAERLDRAVAQARAFVLRV